MQFNHQRIVHPLVFLIADTDDERASLPPGELRGIVISDELSLVGLGEEV
jgi:hypothetical protein